jgi:hypothetical protein
MGHLQVGIDVNRDGDVDLGFDGDFGRVELFGGELGRVALADGGGALLASAAGHGLQARRGFGWEDGLDEGDGLDVVRKHCLVDLQREQKQRGDVDQRGDAPGLRRHAASGGTVERGECEQV